MDFGTGPGWTGFGLLSQTVLARLEDPLQLPAVHPSQVTIGLDRFHVSTSSAFSNQPSLDSLAREEKAPPPHPHTHTITTTTTHHLTHAPACSHKLAEELAHSTGFARSDPSARPPPPPPRRNGIFCRQNLSLSRLFFFWNRAGLLADSLPPLFTQGARRSLPLKKVSACIVSAMLRMSRTVGQLFLQQREAR